MRSQGKHDAALDHFHKALTIYKKVLGNAHPHVAMCLNNIGTVREAWGVGAVWRCVMWEWVCCVLVCALRGAM